MELKPFSVNGCVFSLCFWSNCDIDSIQIGLHSIQYFCINQFKYTFRIDLSNFLIYFLGFFSIFSISILLFPTISVFKFLTDFCSCCIFFFYCFVSSLARFSSSCLVPVFLIFCIFRNVLNFLISTSMNFLIYDIAFWLHKHIMKINRNILHIKWEWIHI